MTTEYQPRDLPDLRLRMAEFWNNHDNHPWVRVLNGNGPRYVDIDMAQDVRHTITDSELFYVAPEIAHVAASTPFPLHDYGFMPWDLPAPCGIMYVDAGHYRDVDGPVSNMVLSWATYPSTETDPHGGVAVFIHAPKHEVRDELYGDHPHHKFDSEQPDYVLCSSVVMPFAESGGDTRFRSMGGDDVGYYLSLLLATCHLMRQTLADDATTTPDRAARRRHARAEIAAPPDVRVVHLRHTESPAGTGESRREFHHRFVVRGHWRKQWYRSIQAHRPVWIAPFVKGPKDAPLLGGEKVYTA